MRSTSDRPTYSLSQRGLARVISRLIPLIVCVLLAQAAHAAHGTARADSPGSHRLTGVYALAAGGSHTCALSAESASGAVCWGSNEYGRLGDGLTTDRPFPVDVAGLPNGIQAIAAGGAHTCALTELGGVQCWGRNSSGQLGDGTTTDRHAPVYVTGLRSGVQTIAAGGSHTCALAAQGAVRCWGNNGAGQIGVGHLVDRLTPVTVSDLGDVRALAAGARHTCALREAGDVFCWGQNVSGQLGDGTTVDRSTPVAVSGLRNDVRALAAGTGHTCAVVASSAGDDGVGALLCWGDNRFGAVGDGTTQDRLQPQEVFGLGAGVSAVGAGDSFTCALATEEPLTQEDNAQAVRCWGRNDRGQLGDGSMQDRLTPADAVSLDGSVAGLAVGNRHACTRDADAGGGVRCWGDNWRGQLGDGSTDDRTVPVEVIRLGETLHLPLVRSQ